MRNGVAFQLPTWAPRICEIESGLLPTPTASAYGTGQNGKRSDGSSFRQAGKPSLSTMARRNIWPTPTAGDAKASGARNTPTRKAHPGVSLSDAVRGDRGTGRRWATPTARDHRNGRQRSRLERTGSSEGDNLSVQAGGALSPTWVEWLMGFPLGWTDLKRSVTR